MPDQVRHDGLEIADFLAFLTAFSLQSKQPFLSQSSLTPAKRDKFGFENQVFKGKIKMGSKVYFDTVAGEWSELRKTFFSEAIREKAFGAVNLEAGKLAADIGAGTGFISQGLAARGVKVIAVDQSEAMLSELSQQLSHRGEIDCRPGDAEQLPIDDETVDYTFANMSLHHVENPAAALKEMARVLKPKGMLVITDLDRHAVELLRREHHDRWMGFEREDIKNWFIEAGFTSVNVDDAGGNCCTDACQTSASPPVSIFIASGQKG